MGYHFFGGEMFSFPMIVFAFFLVMIVIRTLLSGLRGSHLSERREARRMRRAARRHRGPMFDEEFPNREEETSPPSTWSQEVSSPAPEPSQTTPRPAGSTTQAYLNKVQAYQAQINDLLKSGPDQMAISRPRNLAAQVSGWIKAIEDLARRVDGFQQNSLIQQDLRFVPQAIEKLETRLAQESDENMRRDLESTLASRKNQLAALQQLQNTINRAEIKIESTVSALGTLYSQILMAQSTDQVADYSRLAAEVDEEIHTLQDYQAALEEVKLNTLS